MSQRWIFGLVHLVLEQPIPHGSLSRFECGELLFMVNMNDLLQRFDTERLRWALSGLLEVCPESLAQLANGNKVRMYPRPRVPTIRPHGLRRQREVQATLARTADYRPLADTTALDLPRRVQPAAADTP